MFKRVLTWLGFFVCGVAMVVPAPAAAVQAQSALESVVIAQGAHSVSFLPMYVAVRQGYWEEEGLEADIIFTRGGGECLTAVLGGDAVACATATPPLLQAWTRGHTNLISAASLINRFTMNGVVRKSFLAERGTTPEEFMQMSVRDRVRLMEGAVLGVTGAGSLTDIFTRWIVTEAGMDPDRDITMMFLGSGGALYTSLTVGRIDAFVFAPPPSVQPVADGNALTFLNSLEGELEGFTDYVHEVLITRKDLIAERPDLVQKVVNGLRKANNFIADHVTDADALMEVSREFFPELDEAVLKLSLLGVASGIPRDARHTHTAWQAVLDFVEAGGLVEPGALDAAEGGFWTSEFTR